MKHTRMLMLEAAVKLFTTRGRKCALNRLLEHLSGCLCV